MCERLLAELPKRWDQFFVKLNTLARQQKAFAVEAESLAAFNAKATKREGGGSDPRPKGKGKPVPNPPTAPKDTTKPAVECSGCGNLHHTADQCKKKSVEGWNANPTMRFADTKFAKDKGITVLPWPKREHDGTGDHNRCKLF